MAGLPVSKLDIDAFTRVRIILMNGIETEAIRFSHLMARMHHHELRLPLAQIHSVEQHKAITVNWLNPADLSPLETTIGYEQVAIEVTAHLAQHEPDAYLAQAYRFGPLEDFDHMYRYSALLDRVEGKDASNILQGYTDILPGARPPTRPRRGGRPAPPLRPEAGAADHQAQRAHAHGQRVPDARPLHERRPHLRRSGGAPALRRDRVHRGAACVAL